MRPKQETLSGVNMSSFIIESVDSICRDRADTQYMLIQTNLQNS